MAWLQLDFHCSKDDVEALETLLFAHGAHSITLQDAEDEAQFEPAPGETPLWSNIILSALFSDDVAPDTLLLQLNANADFPVPPCNIQHLSDKNWVLEWTKSFQPIRIGQKLWICPSHCTPPDSSSINLILDPGLAFGTGTHPTTALCLSWLDAQAAANHLNGKTIIDYGCGSGILAIAALLLGSERAFAIDYDPQAIQATKDNAQKNNISEKILMTFLPNKIPETLQADIILANILAQPLLTLKDTFARLCVTGGHLILSGVLNSQTRSICNHYENDFTITKVSTEGDWSRIDCTKN